MKRFALILFLSASVFGQAQAPVTYRLNVEASKTFIAIDAAEETLRAQFQRLEENRTALLIGAGVPEGSRKCSAGADKIVVCAEPQPSPSPK